MLINKKSFLFAVLVSACAIAQAQSYSSFASNQGNFNGISVSANSASSTLSVGMSAGATLVTSAQTFGITKIFGVWSLDSNGELGAGFEDSSSPTYWNFNSKYSGGSSTKSIAGWTNNNKSNVILAGNTDTYNYTHADFSKVTGFGFHFLASNGLTYYGTGKIHAQAAPEPSNVMIGLTLFAAGVFVIRRKLA